MTITTTTTTSSTAPAPAVTPRHAHLIGRRVAAVTVALLGATSLLACDAGDELDNLDSDEAAMLDAPVSIAGPERLAALDAEIPVSELSEAELELLDPAPAPVQNMNNVIYQCDIDVLNGSTTCDPSYVDANEFDPGEWTATARMHRKGASFRRMDVFAEICDPTGYAMAIADSPSANGWGGDSGQTDHDAEMHFYNTSMQFFSTVDVLHGVFANHSSLGSAHAGGCQVVHTVTYHAVGSDVGVFSIDGGGSPLTIRDDRGLKLDYEPCGGGAGDPARGISCDHEDAGRDYEKTWHIGLNRTVGSGSRDGSGVQRACVVLGEDVGATPKSCLGPAQTPAEPEGTRKMCITGGTQAQMLADCEHGAQVNLNMFTGGTWDTNDYIAQWGNPCPNGTSIVPQSQFYVANSCNPLPNVGVGCVGPGSFNYEFQLGVMCQ